MYSIVLVDDELPALRYMRAIIEKRYPELTIAGEFLNGIDALIYLEKNMPDILLTDIRMPGMNGIELARRVRAINTSTRIALISGYAEFDYAKGAISASVDDFILKPVSINNLVNAVQAMIDKLNDDFRIRKETLLPLIACGREYDVSLMKRLFGRAKYYFALVRWGNLPVPHPMKMHITSVLPNTREGFTILQGRDEDEQIAVVDQRAFNEPFEMYISENMGPRPGINTWTAIYALKCEIITELFGFVKKAAKMTEHLLVIGERQFLPLRDMSGDMGSYRVAADDLNKLDFFINSSNLKPVKSILFSMAAYWERNRTPQTQVSKVIRRISEQAIASNPILHGKQDSIADEINELYLYAASYGDLIAGLISILFEDSWYQDKNMSAKDLYTYAVDYIRERYAQPLSIRSLCSGLGISQTYLSRLFRKYGDTTFNAFLTKCRIEGAMELIQDHPGSLLREVAACVGYEDPSYFSKVFHQHLGQTPTQYALTVERREKNNTGEATPHMGS